MIDCTCPGDQATHLEGCPEVTAIHEPERLMTETNVVPFKYPTAAGERKCPDCHETVAPPGGPAHECPPTRDQADTKIMAQAAERMTAPEPPREEPIPDAAAAKVQRCFCGSQFFVSGMLYRYGRGGPRAIPWEAHICIQCGRAHLWHHKSGRLLPVESKAAGKLLADELS